MDTSSQNNKASVHVEVCHGRMCLRHAKSIMDRLTQVQEKGYHVEKSKCICMSKCEFAPNICVDGKIYTNMNPIKVAELVKTEVKKRER